MAASTDKRLILRFQFVAWTRLNIQRFFFFYGDREDSEVYSLFVDFI